MLPWLTAELANLSCGAQRRGRHYPAARENRWVPLLWSLAWPDIGPADAHAPFGWPGPERLPGGFPGVPGLRLVAQRLGSGWVWVLIRTKPAVIPAAWAVRNCRHIGPVRHGAGSMPAACSISQMVDGATVTPSLVSSP